MIAPSPRGQVGDPVRANYPHRRLTSDQNGVFYCIQLRIIDIDGAENIGVVSGANNMKIAVRRGEYCLGIFTDINLPFSERNW